MLTFEVKDHAGIVKKPILSSDKLAGCFKAYAFPKKISSQEAVEKATAIVAHETARKNR
jgi:hypothetical protein